jgi:nucleoside-diphosphate-sugar epimerase
LHPEVMRKTLDGAIAAGVRRIVLIATVYPFGRPQTTLAGDDHPRQPHTYKGRMRKEQEDILLAAHAAGKIRATILRLPDFYGPGVDRSLVYDLFRAAARGGTAKLVGPINTPHEFVYVPDVGPVVAALLDHPEADGRGWNLAGAGAITQQEMAGKTFAAAGRKPKVMAAGKTLLRLAGLFDPILRELVEMHYLQTTPVLLDDSGLRAMLGPIHKTPYEEGIRQTLAVFPVA